MPWVSAAAILSLSRPTLASGRARIGIACPRSTLSQTACSTFRLMIRGLCTSERPRATMFFHAMWCFLLSGPSADRPHIGGAVVDSTEAGEADVLRSEVATAIGLLKHQFRRGDFCRHHTLPALVFSFQHDRLGRISQFHFDGGSLVMRQSRLLDFRSDEPTIDAYHMMRWMDNRPIGDTKFGTTIAEVQNTDLQSDRDRTNGKLPIDVRGI
ncbi:hypothetical protein VTK26DRAFT_2866 [Humicola hyalothermophila]